MAATDKNMTFDVNLLPATTGDHNLGSSDLKWKINGVADPKLTDTNTWRGIQDNLTSNTNTTESLSAKQGYLLANGSARDNTKLEKTAYEYNKEITFGSSGKLCIGKFPCYDSNVTIEIKATTGTTYYAVAILATQNINTTGEGTFTWNTYGDSSNTITPNLYAKYASGSNVIEIYFNPTGWSKNLVHIQCSALRGTPTDVCVSIDSIPSDANRQPTNTLLSISTTGNAANVTGTVAVDHGGTGSATAAGARTNLGLGNVDNTADANKTVKYANMLTGFNSRADTMAWGNQTGSVITCLASSNGGGWGFRDNNPTSGELSMTIDGTIYIKEGAVNIGDAVKSFSVSGKTVTYTTLWGNTGTFTTQDTDTDTKNTAGSTNSTSKLYLIGATTQAANPTTNSYQYTYTNNGLLSALKLGLNLNGTEKAHLEWNDTDQSIDFIFA